MSSGKKVWVLTVALWIVMLIAYPFFYSRATGDQILTQGDLILALVAFLVIGIGLALNRKSFDTINYAWGTMTLTWILVANASRLISNTRMEIIDAVYARAFVNLNEWWIVTLLAISGLAIMRYLWRNLRMDKGNSAKVVA